MPFTLPTGKPIGLKSHYGVGAAIVIRATPDNALRAIAVI